MRIPFAFLAPAAPSGAVAIVSAVSYGVVDLAGGGKRVVVTVDSSTGTMAIKGGGVAFTDFAIDDATHVSGVPGAHAAGVVDVVVTNGAGDSTTGTGLIEYFSPHSISPTCELLPGAYAVAGTQGGDAVGTWTDSSGNGNHAVSVGGVSAPVAADGVPDFVAADALYLSINRSIASATGSPPDMATLGAGTQIVFVEPDASSGAASPDYDDAVVMIGAGASAGIVYNDDGITWEAYDEVSGLYIRPDVEAAAVGVKHFACARWNGATWSCRVNGGAFNSVAADAPGNLSNGNVGATTHLGRSYSGARYLDGREHCVLMFATALSDANVTKIFRWGQQRGIAA